MSDAKHWRERAEKAEATLAAPDAAVYNLVWTAARNEVTRGWLASKGLVVMEQAAYDAGLADLRRERGEADLRAEKAEAKLAALDALHPHTELNWWHPCKNHSITDEEPTLAACPNCLIEPVMGCPRCGDDDCEIRKILHPEQP